jgi:predicted RecB family nuclease
LGRLRQLYPIRDICYLHGIIERRRGDNASERYVSFFAADTSPAAEKDAFAAAWSYMKDRPAAVLYFYSKYERTQWRNLRNRYPDVCSDADINALFDPHRAVDLYNDVVMKATEWPTRDYSIKTLAKYLGFEWRDAHPSGQTPSNGMIAGR